MSLDVTIGPLQGARVLAVGGSAGIGEATALLAAQGGAQVCIASRSAERLDGALARLPAGCVREVLDVRDDAAVHDFFAAHAPWQHVVLSGAATPRGLARGLALELAPAVRVNVVSPSTTATPLWDRLGPQGRAQKLADMCERLPLRRVAQAEDIARAILFVATNPFATGSTVQVDGGDALL